MKIHQIRSATIIITYNGKKFLIDPWLMPKDYMPGFESAFNSDIKQPRVDLPLTIEEIVNVDAVILTHFHPDHFDEFAAKAINKNIPFFVQSEFDLNIIKSYGFNDIRIISQTGTNFDGIELYKTSGQHGQSEIFKSKNEKTLYLAGDTIWCQEVEDALNKYKPDVIIINACAATVFVGENGQRLIMDIEDIKEISRYSKFSTIIASHMDTVSHLTITRDDIKNLNLDNVLVPNDNEVLSF